MDLNATLKFDAAPGEVFAMLTDEGFLERKAQATYALSQESTVTRDGDTATVKQMRELSGEELPDYARKFVGDRLKLHQTDQWRESATDGSRPGTISVRISGAPVTLDGTTSLTLVGDGTEYHLWGRIKASVPFVGGKIEQTVHDALLSAVRTEEAAGQRWLAEQRGGQRSV
ncbi:MAG TPA: DUF2505 domain-containing protein [Jiangellaceae bacterium]|nr:DUF2505 domain-containing protein [Jiangellaceae bacterium]